MFGSVIVRFGSFVLFPLIASHADTPRSDLRRQLAPIRAKFLAVAGLSFSLIAAVADLPVRVLYDGRYQAAAWMLPMLIMGSWFSLLANVNEATLLGLGRPAYSAIANSAKFIFLLVALPVGFTAFGILGAIVVIVLCDLFRYFQFSSAKGESFFRSLSRIY